MSNVAQRVMDVATNLGEGVLLFHGMHAREELGRLSEYQLDLLSAEASIAIDDILGQSITVTLAQGDDSTRFFNGYVTRFAQVGMYGRYHRYAATVRPWLWFLTRTADCRIFQEMTVPDILKAVFADHPTAKVEDKLTGTYRKWTYCVQYRETDFNFVSRLMEHEGIYYYFTHTDDGHHTMVLADSCSTHKPYPGCETIPFIPRDRVVTSEIEHVSHWDFAREIQPGVFVHDDYDLERPSVKLRTEKVLPRRHSLSDYEVFDYPGTYVQKADGEQYAAVRIDEFGSEFEAAHASCNVRGVNVGHLFTLDGHWRADQNREYLVVSASYDLAYGEHEALPEPRAASYQCTFSAMSSKQQFRPRRATPKPFVQGPQTAVVVGPAGEEIHTDQLGRVKVQFHWDRRGTKDENSSCWIRVSQPWAGKGWGGVSTPRIGQEVIVDFLEGDPDRPIITGRVYNAECPPPFGFPAGAVTSGMKSATHKGSGFNELSMDDTAGKEKINIHGQYDMTTTVKHDKTTTVNNCRSTTVVVDDTLNVNAKRTIHVKGKLTETIDTGQETTITAGYKETITGGATSSITGGLTSDVIGDWKNTITGHLAEVVTSGEEQTITGEKKITVTGPHTETVTGKRTMGVTGAIDQHASETIDIHATGAGTYTSDASLKLAVAGSVIEITDSAITISAGGSTIKVDAAGVAVNGAKVSLN
jgi:type VI secretion system secreted protein VgrG